MRLALNGQQLGGRVPLCDILERFRGLGAEAIEIWPHNLEGGRTARERERYEAKDVQGAAAVLRASGLSVSCVTLGFHALAVCREEGPQYGLAALQGAVDAAVALGAPLVNCYLAGLEPDLFVAAARPAAAYAGARGVRLALENEAHDASATAEGVRAIVAGVDSPHFGTLFAPCNYYQAGEEAFPYAYRVLREHILYVHLKGGCLDGPGAGGSRGGPLRGQPDRFLAYVPLPDGAVNVDGLLGALVRDGYRGDVALEPHVPPDQVPRFYEVEVPYVRHRIALALAGRS